MPRLTKSAALVIRRSLLCTATPLGLILVLIVVLGAALDAGHFQGTPIGSRIRRESEVVQVFASSAASPCPALTWNSTTPVATCSFKGQSKPAK